jgi:hypothetical protein
MVIISVVCLLLSASSADADSPTGDLPAAEFQLQTPGNGQLHPASHPVDPSIAASQDEQPAPSRPKGMWAGNVSKFFQGAFVALAGHELGHVIANYSLGTDPYLKSVNYGPVPFFTIEPGRPLTNREHYETASAGFSAQHAVNEWLLTTHPNLRAEDEPMLKGMASFNFWLTVGYAASAFAGTGPSERDTKGMANSLGWSEPLVGAMILVPTALDTYRYKHPDAKWAVTASRLSKLAIILLAFDAQD